MSERSIRKKKERKKSRREKHRFIPYTQPIARDWKIERSSRLAPLQEKWS